MFASRKSPLEQADEARAVGDWQRAARLYRDVLAQHPDSAPIWVQYGHALKESGDLAGAETAYREALRREPASPDTHLQLGHALKLQQRRDEAAVAYRLALTLDPGFEPAQLELAALGATAPRASAPSLIFGIDALIEHFVRGDVPVASASTGERTVWTYRTLIGNRPEEDSVVAFSAGPLAMEALLRRFLAVPELHGRRALEMPATAGPPAVDWRIDPAHAADLLAHVARTWTRLGEERPHWSVASADQFLPENMPTQLDAFYRSGAIDAKMVVDTLARIGRAPGDFAVLFEFGCGLGRVTTHLCRHFRRIMACDISPVHLEATGTVLRERGIDNVDLRQATVADFGMPDGFDLWFSALVLQHNSPPLIAMILRRAFAMLRPGGVAIFQVPTAAPGYRFDIEEYRGRLEGPAETFEMHALPQSAIYEIARVANCALLEVREDGSAGPPWSAQVFTFQKL